LVRVAAPAFAALLLPLAATAASRDTTFVLPDQRKPQGPEITIAGPAEPGDRLVIEGRLLRGPGQPIGGATLYVYHADSRGRYVLSGQEGRGNRLAGVLRTNSRGEYRVHTVMPGGYGASRHGHVHFEAWGPGLARKSWWVDVYRESSHRSAWSPGTGAEWAKPDAAGVRHVTWDIRYDLGFSVPLANSKARPPGSNAAAPAAGSTGTGWTVPDSLRVTPHP
jgi:hypothetical protein